MALQDFSIQLFDDESQGPAYYWAVITSSFPVTDLLVHNGQDDFNGGNDPTTNISLVVKVASTNGTPPAQTTIVHEVILGEVQFYALDVTLQGPQGGVITTGSVLSQDAEQETRPWG